jgi:hypothetical protein
MLDYGGIGEKSTVGDSPRLKDLIRRLVWVLPGEVLSRILLGESPFETFERLWVEKVVRVLWFAK